MTAEQLAREIASELNTATYVVGSEREQQEAIIRKHLERVFRMAEATIRDRLSKVRVCDD